MYYVLEQGSSHKQLVDILGNQLFIPNILAGLKTKVPYVRLRYIDFITLCIGPLTKFLQHPTLTIRIKSIITAYFELIKKQKKLEGDEVIEEDDENTHFLLLESDA